MPIVVAPGAPAPTQATDSTSYSGAMHAKVDAAHAGVIITVDFSNSTTWAGYTFGNPFTATVYRVLADGTTSIVRSGDAVREHGAILHAYDDEVPLGTVVGYYAIPVLADGTPGPTSGMASVLTWEPGGGFDVPGVWLKCLEDPTLSMPVRVAQWDSGTYANAGGVQAVIGSPYPAVNLDVRKAYVSTLAILTASETEYQQLLKIADSGVVYVVGLAKHRRRSGYYVMGDLQTGRTGPVYSDYDTWAVEITQVERPSTANQSLAVPGRSFADRKKQYPYFSDVKATGRLFRAGVE